MITAKEISEHVKATPFLPFRIVTSSGEHYDIHHPEFIFITKRTLAIGTNTTQTDNVPERFHTVSVLHITALEPILTKTKKK